MTTWPRVSIGSIVKITGGGTPTRTNPDYFGGDIPWITPKDMKIWDIHRAQVTLTELGLHSSTAKLVPANSVLVVVRSGVLKHTVPVGINRVPVAINQDMKALICSETILPVYLARFIKERSGEILKWVRATTADNFSIEKLKDLKIPLPSIDEQRRIAGVLNRADELRAKRRQAITLLDDLAQSIFLNMFGDLIANDRSWPRRRVAEFVKGFESGKSIAEGEDEHASPYRILKISAVTSGIFKPSESKPAPAGYSPPTSHLVRAGDLLFSRANTSDLVGATALVHGVPEALLLSDKLWRFVWGAAEKVEPLFVHHMFRQPTFRDAISHNATGSSGSMKNISQARVLSIETGLPPLELQIEFVSKVQALGALRLETQQQAKELDELFASLQGRAFRGEL